MGNSATSGPAASPAANDEPAWRTIAGAWPLTPGICFLNHGSFGAPPRVVLAHRQELLARLNANPINFFLRYLQPELAAVRTRLGALLNTAADNLALVENATVGMNAVAHSIRLAPGDEVLTTDHEYGAVLRIWQQTCDRTGARLVVQPLPRPLDNAAQCVDAILAGASKRTRLLVVSHVTSATATVLPVAAICQAARARDVPVCIDGPHALVTEVVDLAALDCDYYTASCHKWLLTPVGAGLLYVHPRAQATIQPAIISWGTTHGQPPSWRDAFNWTGTRDATPLLCIPTALDFLESVGIEAFRARTHYLAHRFRAEIGDLTGLSPLVPDDRAWYGTMTALPLPPGPTQPVQDALWAEYGIEVPIFEWQGQRLVRVSCQMYTSLDDVARLRAALSRLL